MEPIWNPLYISETIIITVFDLESYGTRKEPFIIIGSAKKTTIFVLEPYGTHMEPIWNPLCIGETIIITVFDLKSYGTLKKPFIIIGSAEKNYYLRSGTIWNPYGTPYI